MSDEEFVPGESDEEMEDDFVIEEDGDLDLEMENPEEEADEEFDEEDLIPVKMTPSPVGKKRKRKNIQRPRKRQKVSHTYDEEIDVTPKVALGFKDPEEILVMLSYDKKERERLKLKLGQHTKETMIEELLTIRPQINDLRIEAGEAAVPFDTKVKYDGDEDDGKMAKRKFFSTLKKKGKQMEKDDRKLSKKHLKGLGDNMKSQLNWHTQSISYSVPDFPKRFFKSIFKDYMQGSMDSDVLVAKVNGTEDVKKMFTKSKTIYKGRYGGSVWIESANLQFANNTVSVSCEIRRTNSVRKPGRRWGRWGRW